MFSQDDYQWMSRALELARRGRYTTAPNPIAAYPVIKQAGLLLLTHLYNQRSNTTDSLLREIPFGVATLLRPYKPLIM